MSVSKSHTSLPTYHVGFTGKRCEINIDNCALAGQDVCQNGGTCVDGIDAYTCRCVKGYSGAKLVALGCGGGVWGIWYGAGGGVDRMG